MKIPTELTPQKMVVGIFRDALYWGHWGEVIEDLDGRPHEAHAEVTRRQKDQLMRAASTYLAKIDLPKDNDAKGRLVRVLISEMIQIMSEWKSDTVPEFLQGLDALYIRARVLHDELDNT